MEGAVPKEKGGGADVVAGLSKLKAGVALFSTGVDRLCPNIPPPNAGAPFKGAAELAAAAWTTWAIGAPNAAKGLAFPSSTLSSDFLTTTGATGAPKEKGDASATGVGRGARSARADEKNDGLLPVAVGAGGSGATLGLEKKSAGAGDDAGTAGVTTTDAGAGVGANEMAGTGREGEGAAKEKVEGGAAKVDGTARRLRRVGAVAGLSSARVVAVRLPEAVPAALSPTPAPNPNPFAPILKTNGGSLIFSNSPSSSGGRSSSLAEKTLDDGTCLRDEWDRPGLDDDAAAPTRGSSRGVGRAAGSLGGEGSAGGGEAGRVVRVDLLDTTVAASSSSEVAFRDRPLPFALLPLVFFAGVPALLLLVTGGSPSSLAMLLVCLLLGALSSSSSSSLLSLSLCLRRSSYSSSSLIRSRSRASLSSLASASWSLRRSSRARKTDERPVPSRDSRASRPVPSTSTGRARRV